MTDLTQVLDAVSSALNVIKAVANTPGINIIPYASAVSGAISALQAAYAVGKNIEPYVTAIEDTFSGAGIPSQDKLDALNARIAELEAKVDAPLPAAEQDEPE
jgi:hypothetical protein